MLPAPFPRQGYGSANVGTPSPIFCKNIKTWELEWGTLQEYHSKRLISLLFSYSCNSVLDNIRQNPTGSY